MVLDLIEEYNIDVDKEKVLKLALYHDVGEFELDCDVDSILIAKGAVSKEQKDEQEEKTVKDLADKFEKPQIFQYWKEYQKNETKEAKIVRVADKLESLFHLIEQGKKHQNFDDGEHIAKYADDAVSEFPELYSLLREIKKQLKEVFLLQDFEWKKIITSLINNNFFNQVLFFTFMKNNKKLRKPTKTISGITPVAVMLPPRKCRHGNCIYCPSLDVPQSYTPKSPAVMRAMNLKYDAFEQVKARINMFVSMGHPVDKIELIIMGGTFLEYPKKFQEEFVKACYDAMNKSKSKTLELAKKKNEKAKHRCVALCIETRPDVCGLKEIKLMRNYGCTRVELGVQIIDDKIYEKIQRGHKVEDVVKATKLLKDNGFKIGYHIMPGLPGSDLKKDLTLFKKLFSDGRFKPDQLKIYPCQVMPGSELENWYWNKKFKPYTKKQIENLIVYMLKSTPRYCRIMRIMREIPPEYIVAGTINIDLRRDLEKELKDKKIDVKEIRYREIGFALRDKKQEEINTDLNLKVTDYPASGGIEYFLEFINKDDVLFGLLRLRILNKEKKAIIRELHVYGPALKLGEKGLISQHKGLGKKLMEKAEEISKENNCEKIEIISGVGVREYYKKLGYRLEKNWKEMMVKRIND